MKKLKILFALVSITFIQINCKTKLLETADEKIVIEYLGADYEIITESDLENFMITVLGEEEGQIYRAGIITMEDEQGKYKLLRSIISGIETTQTVGIPLEEGGKSRFKIGCIMKCNTGSIKITEYNNHEIRRRCSQQTCSCMLGKNECTSTVEFMD